MIDETTISHCDIGGCVGAVVFDTYPHATSSRVRPFIWAFLLLRGAVRTHEVVGALAGHVAEDEGRLQDDPFDRTPLEVVIEDALAELVNEGHLRCREDDLFVLTPQALQKAMSLTCSLNAQLPDHLLHEIR